MKAILDVEIDKRKGDVLLVSIHCHPDCNLVYWKSLVKSDDQVDWHEIKGNVARIMDQLSDILRDYHQFGPLVALVELPVASVIWAKIMGDQDWHRGRFVMQSVKTYDGQEFEQVKMRWLGSLSTTKYIPRKITSNDFIRLLHSASENVKPPKDSDAQLFGRYVEILSGSVESGTPEKMAELWMNELARVVNNLLGKPIFEESQ